MLPNSVLVAGVLLIVLNFCTTGSKSATIKQEAVRNFSFRLQPELDVIDLDTFVRKDWVLKFQLKCLLSTETFCDAVGRWLAPRIPYILRDGKCPKCTTVQEQKIAKAVEYVQEARPQIYKALWDRYIQEDGDKPESKGNEIKGDNTGTTNSEMTENSIERKKPVEVTVTVSSKNQ